MDLFSKILVPVDGSRYSLDAVRLATKVAKAHGSALKIFHVVDVSIVNKLKTFTGRDEAAILEELTLNARTFLADMEYETKKEGVRLDVLIKEGLPHEAILKEASLWGADLIVMGKLGRRGTAQVLLGSVTERVIEFSEVPVLVVK
jgi:nucleotide-binding universal stress UspA family protein